MATKHPERKMLAAAVFVVGFTAVMSWIVLWLAGLLFESEVSSAKSDLSRLDVANGARLAMSTHPERLCSEVMTRASVTKDLTKDEQLFLPFCRAWDWAKYDGLDGAEALVDFANFLVLMGVVIESLVHLSPSWRQLTQQSGAYGHTLNDHMEGLGARALVLGLFIEAVLHMNEPLLTFNRFSLAMGSSPLGSAPFIWTVLVLYGAVWAWGFLTLPTAEAGSLGQRLLLKICALGACCRKALQRIKERIRPE